MDPLVGTPKVEVVELKAPVTPEGEVGDDIIADTGAEAGEVFGFVLHGSCPFDRLDPIVKESEKLEFIVELFPAGKSI